MVPMCGGVSGRAGVCPVLWAPLGRLGGPYAEATTGETGQGYAASVSQRPAAKPPHNC